MVTAELLRLTHAELLQEAQRQAERIAELQGTLCDMDEAVTYQTARRLRAVRWAWSYRQCSDRFCDVAIRYATRYGNSQHALVECQRERDAVRDLHRSDLKAARVEIEAHFAARMQMERERDLLANESARLRAALDEATEIIVNLLYQHADACGACDDAESRLGPEDVRELDRARQKRRRAALAGKEKP